ncbi:MAG: LysR family transcriptional regulator [Pseudomonadota bacterium]
MNAPVKNLSDTNQPLLFEMIRSFVTLARTLNLSHAVDELQSTRQTVRRHIAQLEKQRGAPLFEVRDRRYELTDEGVASLPEALDLMARAHVWSRGQTGSFGALQYLRAHEDEWQFYQQQQPLGRIWVNDSVLLREAFRAWTMAGSEIESPHLAHVRPHLMVYRQSDTGWICVEFGAKSAYVQWFGIDYARSNIGRPIAQMPAGEEFGRLLYQSFQDIETTQAVRLDHVFTRMPKRGDEAQVTMVYQRLMMAGLFPDGSPAVLTLVVPTANVNIRDLPEEKRTALTQIHSPDFEADEAKFEKIAKTLDPSND